jgi:chromosome segregation ATPase
MAQIDDLQSTVANLENQRNNFNRLISSLKDERDVYKSQLSTMEEALKQESHNLKNLFQRFESVKTASGDLMLALKSKDQLIAKQEQLIANQKKEFEFLQKNLNDTICHLRTKLDEKINAVKALTSALDKKILATEPVKRKYVRKETKK